MAKIAMFEIKESWEKSFYQKELKGHEIKFFKQTIQEVKPESYSNADIISTFIYSRVTKDIIDNTPNLRFITTRSTGFDHIDCNHAKSKGISVSNVPNYGENTVAEHTFALILSLSRNIHKSYVRTIRGEFSIEGLRGFDLRGKTIGIVGTGRIGLHVVKMALGFGMNVIAYDRNPNTLMSSLLGFRYVSFDELISTSDIISLHIPYFPETHHLINIEAVKKMKKGVIIINTSRGGLIDNDALLYGLNKGIIAGVGLDVIEGEEALMKEDNLLTNSSDYSKLVTALQSNILLHRENVVFTPHNAFNSIESVRRIAQTTVDNIKSFLQNKLINVVNK
ncbi:MAG: hydroxyacid dehydrogenase [Spirochaetia bacterium]|nr:hydroxyacid dehydrogenase [Spirochaetota bacterium]MCX8096848.1 hydroxyacid dehydrogenase [Spirochaetota bacterium]MDW8111782.1 hydroxyacid dehydrogenase [Spirochaetia bacterium]